MIVERIPDAYLDFSDPPFLPPIIEPERLRTFYAMERKR
jgi:hypothetical protein